MGTTWIFLWTLCGAMLLIRSILETCMPILCPAVRPQGYSYTTRLLFSLVFSWNWAMESPAETAWAGKERVQGFYHPAPTQLSLPLTNGDFCCRHGPCSFLLVQTPWEYGSRFPCWTQELQSILPISEDPSELALSFIKLSLINSFILPYWNILHKHIISGP